MARTMTSTDRLLAAYGRFAQALADIPDGKAQELQRLAAQVAEFVDGARARRPDLTENDLAGGLSQGLDELPALIDEVDVQWRWAVARALHDALAAECPDLVAHNTQRLQAILARGRVGTQGEFLLVRHRIDVLEAEPELSSELRQLYALAAAWPPPD
jgi:hypothetical protein